ncbi:hypothetical protein EDB19DRAFT_1909212 [Suillus lakei]|nr:hypothetical protein EDB19DRAFT_1909212 [Suillus lakei]
MLSDSDLETVPPLPKHKNNTDELLQAVSIHKMKKTKGKADSDPMKIYLNAGRKASCVLDLFGLPSVAFYTGLRHDRGGNIDDDLTEEVKRRHLHLYKGILNIIPSLRDKLNTISSNKLSKIISAITKGMSDAPSSTKGSMDALNPPIPEVEDKSMQGITHPQLARWLCPQNKLDVFNHDPDEGMEKLQSGKLKMTAMNWPTGFYEDSVYDPMDKTKGMFRNHVVARWEGYALSLGVY